MSSTGKNIISKNRNSLSLVGDMGDKKEKRKRRRRRGAAAMTRERKGGERKKKDERGKHGPDMPPCLKQLATPTNYIKYQLFRHWKRQQRTVMPKISKQI